MTNIDLAKRFSAYSQAGDVEGALSCLHPDAQIWQNFDGKTKTPAELMATLELMKVKCESFRYEIHRVEEISDGYIQRHTLHMTGKNGATGSTEVVVIARVEDGKIRFAEEFLDPSPFLPVLSG